MRLIHPLGSLLIFFVLALPTTIRAQCRQPTRPPTVKFEYGA
jgi:hypothetical protein